jgi:hypothetical protein
MPEAKIYKLIVSVLDFDDLSEGDVIHEIENNKFLSVDVVDIKSAEIDDWTDDHPLNNYGTFQSEFERIFGK